MKLIKNLLKTLTVALCGALVLASCKGAIDNPGQGQAYLRATANPAGKSVLFPVYELEDFNKYELSGVFVKENLLTATVHAPVPTPIAEPTPIDVNKEDKSVTLGSWESYEDFESAYIAIPETGIWNFVLDAYTSEGTHFSAKVEKVTINNGSNSINFPLKAKEYAAKDTDKKGGLSVSFELEDADFTVESNDDYEYEITYPDYSVSATLKKGENLGNAEVISIDDEDFSFTLLPAYDSDDNKLSDADRFGEFSGIKNFTGNFLATLTKAELDSGYYWVTFSVNKGTFEGIITKTVFVIVFDGKTTTEEEGTSVTEIVKANDVIADEAKITFKISYDYNGGTIVDDDDYTPPTTYCSRDTAATVLPTADNIVREGFIFLGWKEILKDDSLADGYTTELLSDEDNIVEGNREYKAIWQWDSSQTITIAKNGENGTYASQTFSWNEVPGATGYAIYTKESEDDDWNWITNITGTSYFISPSFNNDEYYAVKAYNTNEDVYSDDYSNTITYDQLASLDNPVVTEKDGVLTWTPVYGATEYRIYKCESDGETPLTSSEADAILNWSSSIEGDTLKNSQTLSYVLVSKFEKYVYYAVKAYNSVDNYESGYSQLWRTDRAPAPIISYEDGVLSWNAVNEATAYTIYSCYSDSSSVSASDLSVETTKNATDGATYAKENLSATQYLCMAVKASKSNAETGTTVYSGLSNIVAIAPKDFTPPVLTSAASEDTKGDIVISWDEVEGATGGYNVYYYFSNSGNETLNSLPLPSASKKTPNTYDTIHLNSTTEYKYVIVKPYNTFDSVEGAPSNLLKINPLNLSFSSTSVPNKTDTDTPTTKRISWEEVADATGYRVYYYSSSSDSVTSSTIVSNNTYHDTENTYYDFTNASTSNYLYIAVQPYFYSEYFNNTYYGTTSSVCQIDYIHLPEFSSSVDPVTLSWSNEEGNAYISFSETADYTYIYKYSSTSDLALGSFNKSLFTEPVDVCSSASGYKITLPAAGTYDYYAVRNGDDDATSESYSNVIKVYSNVSALQESHNGSYYFTETAGTWTSNNKGRASTSAVSKWQTSTSADMIYYSCDWTVSSEPSYDKLTIEENSTTKVYAPANKNDKIPMSGTISGFVSGNFIIKATYTKDSSQDHGNDCGTLTFTQLYLFFD